MKLASLALVALAACSSGPSPTGPTSTVTPDARVRDAGVAEARGPEWLKGNTHAHAAPSGDSAEPVLEVIRWYQEHDYDFLVLTDHNRVSQVHVDVVRTIAARAAVAHAAREAGADAAPPPMPTVYYPTAGEVTVSTDGLIVIAGIELTYNPVACEEPSPPPDGGKCRIHANLLGVTARPEGKLEWANRTSLRRADSYQAALDQAKVLGGMLQINHPNWWWGMTGELLAELARRGVTLVEISNVQFAPWNAGDLEHPSIEEIWDVALTSGADIWGVASDDAHDYDELEGGRYPPGGGWIVVWAVRDADAILEAIRAGRFYASTGVALARAEVDGGELVVEVAEDSPGDHSIQFIGDGRVLTTTIGRAARHDLSAASYVRAVVTRVDGAKAWTQPARGR